MEHQKKLLDETKDRNLDIYASYSEALNGVLYITPNTNELLKLSQALNKLTLEFTRVKDAKKKRKLFMRMRNDNSDSRKD